jgi:nitroimidazol reductase NimA-like FMN-containing flavoprotein (pyridoxamine 5'-phosphate oxidase superfamily)
MDFEGTGVELLSRQECLALLGQTPIGRVVISERALPAAFPVHFGLLGDDVVFRTASGGRLASAVQDAVVAFEADEMDYVDGWGWSVLVQGRASLLTDPLEIDDAELLALQPHVPGKAGHFVRIPSRVISGRRLRVPVAPPLADDRY